ncbi:TaqI-like C-terminal specificity domain-containing protein [Leptolyngbya sp. AN02str]|uniref:TaqI-like C-terminal specificity domain-containing protein n=1 Tax=Leptolyngbya sp. AN02str TaxID=3423363 RepID=UPI003D3104CE
MKPALTGRDIDPYYYESDNFLLFPYKEESGKIVLIQPCEMVEKYPKAWNYLNHSTNQIILRGRDKGDFQSREDWYGYGRPQNMHLLGISKIVLPDVAGRAEFTYDSEGRYIIDTSYAITLKRGVSISSLALTAILNSSLMTFFLKQTGTDLRGGYFRMKTAYLNPFPIPQISFTTSNDRRQQAFQDVIALYDKFQLDHNPDPLLAKVDYHLSQQPEETDVIHDLLAHLAEQMIELNKQKQAEIKSFFQWLERFVGCDIDNLSNKSKIQNYLGDYYKKTQGSDMETDIGEPHLSFDDFIELLKKNKKKLKIDPAARKEQQTLEKEYQNSLDVLLPIKMQLMRCDRLIDAIVYKLYGLIEEEIAIVEGS